MTTYLSLNRRYTPSKPLEQCYSGSLLIVEFMVMNKLTFAFTLGFQFLLRIWWSSVGHPRVHKASPGVVLVMAISLLSMPDGSCMSVKCGRQALMNDNLPQLEQALYTIKTYRTVLQWIPSHSGVYGNEQADRLAKHGAGQQQQENPVCLTEMKNFIKSL
jgi:hypothetical protein